MKKRMSRRKRSHILYGYLMIAPLTVGLGVFYFYPFFKVLGYSLDKFIEKN